MNIWPYPDVRKILEFGLSNIKFFNLDFAGCKSEFLESKINKYYIY